jgi:molybdopterin synthase sulfur carrier subunit
VIRVLLPAPLRTLARVGPEVHVDVAEPVTTQGILDALETAYPALRGTVRDPVTHRRRPFVRFFVGEEDLSHQPPTARLPDQVAAGEVPFAIIGAMAGG